MIRALCLIGGLTGAAGLSQFPEFSQQYLQRLGGQVDELTRIVKDFDQTALADGFGREEMLEQMAQTPLVAGQEEMWRRTFARHARLSESLVMLREAGPIERLTLPHHMADGETLAATWSVFTPAVPVSLSGATAAGTGFLLGWATLGAVLSLLVFPFRRSSSAKPKVAGQPIRTVKKDPPVMRPKLVAPNPDNRPRLAGVQR